MIHPSGTLLIVRNDTPADLDYIKQFIRDRGLTQEDVSLTRRDGLLQLRAKREVGY